MNKFRIFVLLVLVAVDLLGVWEIHRGTMTIRSLMRVVEKQSETIEVQRQTIETQRKAIERLQPKVLAPPSPNHTL